MESSLRERFDLQAHEFRITTVTRRGDLIAWYQNLFDISETASHLRHWCALAPNYFRVLSQSLSFINVPLTLVLALPVLVVFNFFLGVHMRGIFKENTCVRRVNTQLEDSLELVQLKSFAAEVTSVKFPEPSNSAYLELKANMAPGYGQVPSCCFGHDGCLFPYCWFGRLDDCSGSDAGH